MLSLAPRTNDPSRGTIAQESSTIEWIQTFWVYSNGQKSCNFIPYIGAFQGHVQSPSLGIGQFQCIFKLSSWVKSRTAPTLHHTTSFLQITVGFGLQDFNKVRFWPQSSSGYIRRTVSFLSFQISLMEHQTSDLVAQILPLNYSGF